jgi:hypothetical protein
MLTDPARRRRPRPQQSLRQDYEEFILQRIEEFKNQLSRDQLLAIADEAVQELEVGPEDQLVLTEVLVLEHVDRLIMRRLNLPTYRRWRQRHVKLRKAQREATHWGIEPTAPLVGLATDQDLYGEALVVGAGAAAAALYLAAHDWPVVFIAADLTVVESIEARVATEALAAQFQALVVDLGEWFPDVRPSLTVIDPGALGPLDGPQRGRFFDASTTNTVSGGVHCILPIEHGGRLSVSPDGIRAHYAGWLIDRSTARVARGRWFVATKP